MKNKKKFYVTTPIYYANSEPHVGSVYTTIAADSFARWHRLKGDRVFFLTGTDEHGQKIQEIAEKAKKDPQKFVDEIAGKFKEAFKLLNISNDFFIRTTNKEHEKDVQKILQELYDKKLIYKGEYEAYYCVGCEQYLNKSDLVDGCCPLHKKEPELRKEEAYLFKLSSFQEKLLKLIKSGEFNILPLKKRNEVISFIESGLQDVSISRLKKKVSWGIELPFDKKHTCFVWVDAFWNYITGLKINKKFDKFWPPNLQLMANDILRVHATIWPALLLALNYKLPKTLFIHGYFTINGEKMSKSLGNAISPFNLVEKYGVDSVRYFLMRNISFGDDGDFSEKTLIERHNSELADKLGNLVSRVSALAEKYGIEKTENKLLKKLKIKEISGLIENYELDKALNLIFEFVDNCNLFVQENEIWKSGDKKKLYQLADSIKATSILLWAFMPATCEKIGKVFGFEIKTLKQIKEKLKISKIKKAEILFKKVEVSGEKVNKPQENRKIEGIMTMNEVEFEEWEKLDLRVGKIIKIEDIEGADKLYKLEIDLGKEKRIVVAGLKKHYKKDELKNKKCILFVNLASRMMRGIESKGMILAAVNEDESQVKLIQPDDDIELGSKVR